MATASVTYTFVPLTLAESSKANTNFADLVSFLNTQTMHRDASSAFTAIPSGPALNPSSDNQLTRKKYVDDLLVAFLQKDVVSVPFVATSAVGGSVVFPVAFASTPVVQLTVQIGSNLDVLPNLVSRSTTGFSYRLFQKDGNALSATATLNWVAFKP